MLVSFLVLASAACAHAVSQTPRQSPHGQDALARAKEAEAKHDFVVAAAFYRDYLKTHPDQPGILQRLGLDYYLSNRFDEAIPALDQAFKLDSSLWGSALFLGISYYRAGRFREAIEPLQRALALKPDLDEARFWLGSTLLARGEPESAIPHLLAASKDLRVGLQADSLLVDAYRRAADDYYQRIARLEPDCYRVHQLKAESLAWKNLSNQALMEYREALKRKSDLEGVHRSMGELYWQRQQFDQAAKEYEAELRLNPTDDQANLRLGEYWLAEGDSSRAVAYLNSALAAQTEAAAEAHHFLGAAELAQKNLSKAEAALKLAVRENPQDPSNHMLLKKVYELMGRPDVAEKENELFQNRSKKP